MPGNFADNPRMLRVDHGVVTGTFSLDGQTFDVDNNIWVVGDDDECVVIDAPHDVEAILAVVGDRQVRAIVCTHAHEQAGTDESNPLAPLQCEPVRGVSSQLVPFGLGSWRVPRLPEAHRPLRSAVVPAGTPAAASIAVTIRE